MRVLSIISIITLLLFSCQEKVVEAPPPINKEQMVNIITDIQLVEAKLNYEKRDDVRKQKLTEKYYESVFSKYNISEEEFEESLYYYKKDIEALDQIYSDVITKLSKIESDINSILDSNYTNNHDSTAKAIVLGKKKVQQNTKP